MVPKIWGGRGGLDSFINDAGRADLPDRLFRMQQVYYGTYRFVLGAVGRVQRVVHGTRASLLEIRSQRSTLGWVPTGGCPAAPLTSIDRDVQPLRSGRAGLITNRAERECSAVLLPSTCNRFLIRQALESLPSLALRGFGLAPAGPKGSTSSTHPLWQGYFVTALSPCPDS